jgi:predicted nucleotide-binding protein (sugar kinase/HSP70/actin superfamily)
MRNVHVHIGIPRAMLYHEFGSLWTNFFQNAGIPVSLSDETNKQILDRGTLLGVDEACLPLKVYLGHVDSLLSKCSHIFVPRVVQYHRDFFFCAKFAGLPDVVRNTFRLPPERIISPNIEYTSSVNQLKSLYNTCQVVGLPPISGYLAYRQALKSWKTDTTRTSMPANRKIAVIGHSYLLNDVFFCHDILKFLASRKIDVITPNHVASKVLYDEAKAFEPDIYWQLSAKIAGAAHFFCRQPDIVGIIMISSFGCGPDSLVNEYVEHHVFKKSDKPYIIINIDEHMGNAGLITRIEAFWDLVEWRQKS